ncbi:hypothetical protein FRC12_023301 [Ceratobasidium sp. 428]|nr:hypothetical protein FRC12_023301 [Ceratobasidium sp. 428]
MPLTSVLAAAFIALGSVQAATSTCKTLETGALWTNTFQDTSGNEIRRPYAFNSKNEVAYYKTGTRPPIVVEFQTCNPNYAQVSVQPDNLGRYFGRFRISNTNQCLAVSNPSGAPPYYVTSKPCPAPADIATKAFTAFNFVGYQNDEINYQWYGATIPSKKKYQGPEPGATNCQGSYSVNATGPAGQHNYPGLGEPSTLRGEDYRVHLYCPKGKGGKYVSAFNNFILINQ